MQHNHIGAINIDLVVELKLTGDTAYPMALVSRIPYASAIRLMNH